MKFKVGDRVKNVLAAEDGEEDRFVYGVVNGIVVDREGQEKVEVVYPGYYYADIDEEYLQHDTREVLSAATIAAMSIRVADIEADHIPLGIIDGETGKQGVRHLYSDRYRERWPQDQYPEMYEEDTI